MKTKKTINTALCSFGMSGSVFHAPILDSLSQFKLISILERTKNLSRRNYPSTQLVRSFDEIINDKNVDLAIVNTPNEYHYEMAKSLLNHGKHVVVEKPFTVNTNEGKKLIALAQNKQLHLSVFHNKRYEGDFIALEKALKNKTFGSLQEVHFRFDRFRPEVGKKVWKETYKPGAGMLYDLGSHLIDQALYLFGEPNAIKASLKIQRPKSKVIDYFDIQLIYNSFHVFLSSTFLSTKPIPKFKIVTDEGIYEKIGNDPQEEQLKTGITPENEIYGIENEENCGVFKKNNGETISVPSEKGCYEMYYQSIANSILHQSPLAVSAQEGLNVIKVIEKAMASSKNNTVVDFQKQKLS